MGAPLLVALLGRRAAGPLLVTLTVDLVLTSSLCIGLSRLHSTNKHGTRVAVGTVLRGIAANPLPWAIIAGAVTSAFSLALPNPVMQTLGFLADAASPVDLFAIGALLARSQMATDAPIPRSDYMPLALIKSILHPLLVLSIGHGAIYLGIAVDQFSLKVITLATALPLVPAT